MSFGPAARSRPAGPVCLYSWRTGLMGIECRHSRLVSDVRRHILSMQIVQQVQKKSIKKMKRLPGFVRIRHTSSNILRLRRISWPGKRCTVDCKLTLVEPSHPRGIAILIFLLTPPTMFFNNQSTYVVEQTIKKINWN